LERGRGDDGWAVGDEVVGDAGWIMANHNGVGQEFAEPFGRGSGVSWECECCGRDIAVVIWNGESDAGEVRIVCGTNQMQGGDAGGADQTTIQGIDGPGAVELEAAGGADGGGGDFYGVEGFDGVDLDAGQAGQYWLRFHQTILTEWFVARPCASGAIRKRFAATDSK